MTHITVMYFTLQLKDTSYYHLIISYVTIRDVLLYHNFVPFGDTSHNYYY